MTDTPTALADVIVPEVFNPYFREMTTRVNAFFQSGVVAPVADLNFGNRGGTQIQMPFWQALGERAQLLDDTEDLEIRKVTAAQDTAVQHARSLVYGGTDLAAALAGDDPMDAIAAGFAENWSFEWNMQIIATLAGATGALAGESPAVNTLDISALSGAASNMDGASFIDATQTMGDAKGRVVAVAMHSAVEAWLAKNDLIEFIRESEGSPAVPTFMGKRVIVDDALAPSNGTYTSYLFGAGAIGFGEGNPKVPSETFRQPLAGGGQDALITRRHYVLHPRGIRWIGTPAGVTPSDAELANPANWARVYESKNIRIVRFLHTVG